MIVAAVLLLFSLGIILFSSIVFTNGIELLGERCKLHQGAVGSILAAIGTALPETIIPIIAIVVYADPTSREVAIGAIAGAPFMLGTLAMFVTGFAVLVYAARGKRRRSREMDICPRALYRDLSFFLGLYGVAVLATFVRGIYPLRIAIAIGLALSYIWYIKCTMSSDGRELETPEALILTRWFHLPHGLPAILAQVIGSLVIMILGSHMFVGNVGALSNNLGISAILLSLIVTPIATELPEKFNSVIWIKQRKDILSLGNITGAMVFQSSFPVAFGVVFTSWNLLQHNKETLVSALLALASGALILTWVKLKKSLSPYILMVGGLLYAIFFAYVLLCVKAPPAS